MGAPTIATRNPYQPLSFARARNGYLLAVDGLSRGLVWDGVTASAKQIGIDAATDAPSITPAGSGSNFNGTYIAAYRYVEKNGAINTYGNISEITTFTATTSTGSQAQWSGIKQPVSTNDRVTHIQLLRSTAGEATTLYLVTELTANPGGADATYTDTTNDLDLSENVSLPVTLPDGSLSARRFGVPPSYTPFIAQFQDRMFYAGRVKYAQGTVATSANTTITGTGTDWNADMAGRYIVIDGEPQSLLIDTASATSITTATAATTTASGKTYAIVADPLTRNQIFFSETDEPESVPSVNVVTVQENTGDEDEITGLMPYGLALYVLKERHVYSLTFVRQPIIDASIHMVTARGCVNNRSWVYFEGMAYLLDEQGIYRFNGYQATPISEPIQDLFRDGTLDWENRKWFFATVDQARALIYFFVGFDADNSTRPKKALVYNVRNETWSVDHYLWELGGGCVAHMAGKIRTFLGAEDDQIVVTGEGLTDLDQPIPWSHRSGLLEFPRSETWNKRSVRLIYEPTTTENTLDIQLYRNHDPAPQAMRVDQSRGTGVITVKGSSRITVDLQRTQSTLDQDAGFKEFQFGGLTDDRSQGARWVGIDLSGEQEEEAITVYAIEVDGV